jgi:hypothetical protein
MVEFPPGVYNVCEERNLSVYNSEERGGYTTDICINLRNLERKMLNLLDILL